MEQEQQPISKGWGHRLWLENRGLKERTSRLKKEKRLLQQELRKTWKLLEDIPTPLFLVQQEKIIFASQMARRQLGYTEEEMSRKRLSDLVYPDAASAAESPTQRRGMAQVLSGQNDVYLKGKSGQTLCCEVRVNEIRHQGRKALLCNFMNLDRRKEQEKRRRQSAKTEALLRMASGFGRALEESLAELGEHIQRTRGHKPPGRPFLRSLGRLEAIGERGTLLSGHLNCLTEAEYHLSDVTLLNLKEVLKKAVSLSQPKVSIETGSTAGNIRFKTYLRSLSPVYGCKRELQDAFVSIILNAVEALPGRGEVYLTTEEHSGFACLYFQDNGVGMSQKIMDRIFDPFFTTKAGVRRGLGLSLAQAIVGRHGGNISVTSHQGQGSTFLVKLPLAGRFPFLKVNTSKKGIKDAHILLVGDEGIVTNILYELFRSKGGEVTTASSHDECLKLLRHHPFDLVIMDQNTPYTETARNIRVVKKLKPDLPVALINARGNPGTGNRPGNMGPDLVLRRPLDMDRLVSRVSSLLEKRASPP